MNCFGKIAVCFAGGLALSVGFCADDDTPATSNPASDNPYAAVIARNIFGLNPPAPPAPPPDPILNLPKITPSGIMGVYGHYRVLFKVNAAPKPGQPAKDQFYNLSEGQRQDDIEIVKIDDKNKLVTFNNHGTMQELPLANTPASAGPSPTPAAASPIMPGAAPVAAGRPTGGPAFTRFGAGRPGGNGNNNPYAGRTPGSTAGANGASPGLNFQSVPTRIYQPEAPTMSPEESQILIVAQHLKAQQEGDPTAKFFPPTSMDKEAGINP
jgi:hypothetical protein